MGRQDEIVRIRVEKINELIREDKEPYAYSFGKKNSARELKEKYAKLKAGERTKDKVKIAGRIMTVRDIGKLIFADLQDQGVKIQVQLQEGETEDEQVQFFKKYIDMGDNIGVEGKIIRTKRGELSVLADKIELLSKSLLPLPEKWHGLQDKEERYRKRYLDLIMNPAIKQIFETRARILKVLRKFMEKNNFIEIETPLLQGVYGGANAKPFKTHCDAFNSDMFLSIAPELYLKKALVGGFERVYEITKKFRNEGVDKMHNPEHMTIEWYQAYADYNDGMDLFEEMMKDIAKELTGGTIIEFQGNKIDLGKWERISLADAIKKHLNEDISKIKTDEDAKRTAKKHNIPLEGITRGNIADELMKLFRDKLIQPTFLIDYPIELAPLAKPKRGDDSKAEVFQPFIGGMELARAYSELNDPALQEKHFEEQESEREKGNQEAMPTDQDFVNALEYGMPPACGVGIGIERLTMLFTDSTTIRDVIMFPFMKPMEEE